MITMTESSTYKILTEPTRVKIPVINKSGNPLKDNKVDIRVEFKQENLDNQEISLGSYTYKNFKLIDYKIGDTFTVVRKKGHNGLWYITVI